MVVRKMGKKRLMAVFSAAMVGSAIYFGLFNYKPFVDFVFEFGDEVADDEFDPANSDVAFDGFLSEKRQFTYGEQILQPSGVDSRGSRMLITTDTSDVFLTDGDGTVIDSVRIKNGPLLLRQGFSEGVAWVGDSSAVVIAGEGTKLIELSVAESSISVERTINIDLPNPAAAEVAAIGYNDADDTISLTLADSGAVRTLRLDRDGVVVDEAVVEVPGVDPEGQDVVGSAVGDSVHYVLLTQNVVLAVDVLTGELIGTWALAYDGDVSGIAVTDDELLVVTDHEYYEASPALRSFELPSDI